MERGEAGGVRVLRLGPAARGHGLIGQANVPRRPPAETAGQVVHLLGSLLRSLNRRSPEIWKNSYKNAADFLCPH